LVGWLSQKGHASSLGTTKNTCTECPSVWKSECIVASAK